MSKLEAWVNAWLSYLSTCWDLPMRAPIFEMVAADTGDGEQPLAASA